MRRDRLTFAMIIGIPVIQLVLFGYAINTDPKQLPTAVVVADYGADRARDHRCDADLGLFRHRRRRRDRGFRPRAARPRRRELHRHHSRRLSARAGQRRASAAPRRGRRHRPRRHGERARCAQRDRPRCAGAGNRRSALPPRAGDAAGRCRHPPPLQPRGHHLVQHRSRPARRHPHHDDDPDDFAGAHPRGRARHDRESPGHAGAPLRDHDRQDRPLYRLRLRPGRDHPGRRASFSSTCR